MKTFCFSPLPGLTAEIRCVRLSFLDEEMRAEMLRLLPAERRERILRLKRREDRTRSLLGDYLSRSMIAERLSIPMHDVEICYTENGKPETEGICFSVSHSGDFVACAISHVSVGVDVEAHQNLDLRLSRMICTEEEQEALKGMLPELQGLSLLKLWVLKEARVKCLDTGLMDMQGGGFTILPEGSVLCSDPTLAAGLYAPYPGCALGICLKKMES